jgi:hypothetical protein
MDQENSGLRAKFGHFIDYLQDEFANVEKERALLTENKITYELLWFLFPVGCEVAFIEPQSGTRRAGKVSHSQVFTHSNRRCHGLGIRRIQILHTFSS